MIQLPLYYMRFPQQVMGTYSDLWGRTSDMISSETPQWNVLYRLAMQNKKHIVQIWLQNSTKYETQKLLQQKIKKLTPLQLKNLQI